MPKRSPMTKEMCKDNGSDDRTALPGDAELWASATERVRPLGRKDLQAQTRKPALRAGEAQPALLREAIARRLKSQERDAGRPDFASLLKKGRPRLLDPEENDGRVAALRVGLPPRILQQLWGGDFPVEKVLDLHGVRLKDAPAKVDAFLVSCFERQVRCVLVVTGRSRSRRDTDEKETLQSLLPRWLSESWLGGVVLAFVEAPPELGGAGALLVLLRRTKGYQDLWEELFLGRENSKPLA